MPATATAATTLQLVFMAPEQLTPDELLDQMPAEEAALLARMPVTTALLAWLASLQAVPSSLAENIPPKRRSPFSRRGRRRRRRDPEARLAAARATLRENPTISKSQLARELGISRSWAGELRRRVLVEED